MASVNKVILIGNLGRDRNKMFVEANNRKTFQEALKADTRLVRQRDEAVLCASFLSPRLRVMTRSGNQEQPSA